jgi:hypothetical protein
MVAVVLRGPANTAPEAIVGPFDSLGEAERWSHDHPRHGGYCVAEELTAPDDVHPPRASDS